LRAAATRLDRPSPLPAHRVPLWLLLVPLPAAVGYGLAEGSAPTLAALAAAALIVLVLLFPRQTLLAGLAAVSLADVSIRGVPVGEILVAAVTLGLLVRILAGDSSLKFEHPPAWLTFGFALILYLLLASSVFNGALDGEAFRRFGHLAVGGMLAWLLAARVVDPKMAAKGLVLGLLATGLIGLAEVTTGHSLVGGSNHGNRLSGWFGDPNVAGFYLVALGTAALGLISSKRAQLGLGAVLLVLVFATESRTALVAAAVVVAWVIASHNGYKWLPIVALVACGVVAFSVPQQLKEAGPFRDRGQSDWFREDVDRKTAERAAASLLVGEGAAPALVAVQGGRFFPHNSYHAAVIEGGIFWLLAWITLLGSTLWKLVRANRRNVLLEAGIITVFVISLSLGETLFELPTMILVGLALAYLATDTRRNPQVSARALQPPGASRPAPGWGAPATP